MPRVVVLGSCTFDIVFRMPRFPRPGETLFARDVGFHAGGKGLNQAIAAARLGAAAAIIGRVGADDFGRQLRDALAADDVDLRHLQVDPAGWTGLAAPVVLDDGANSILAAPGANLAVTVKQVEAARDAIAAADALLLQFEAPMEANLAAARIARAAGRAVLLNPAPALEHPPELLALATALVLNEVEAEQLVPGRASHEERAAALREAGPGLVVVTLGPEGAIAVAAEERFAVPAFPVRAVDSVGAGDAFCGALAVALAEGQPPRDAVRFACAAGALTVTGAGAAPSLPRRVAVEALLAR